MSKEERSLDWKKIIVLSLSTMINIPVMNIGHSIGERASALESLVTIIGVNLVLTSLMLWLVHISFTLRKSPIESIGLYFNKSVNQIFSTALFISSCIWFATQLQAISQIVNQTMEISNPSLCSLFLGISFTFFLQKNLKRTLILSNYTLFLSSSFLVYFFYQVAVISQDSVTPALFPISIMSSLWNLSTVNILINGSFLATIELPYYYRHGKTKKETFYAIVLCFGLMLSVVEILGALIAVKCPHMSLIECLQIWANAENKTFFLLFIFLSGCCINNINLYSGVLSLKNILPKTAEEQRVFITGLTATILSCFNVHYFHSLMIYKLIISAVMVAVICVRSHQLTKQEYIFNPTNKRSNGTIASISILFGIASAQEILYLTGSAVIDSFTCAFTLSLIFTIFPRIQSYYKKQHLTQYLNIPTQLEEKIYDSTEDLTSKLGSIITI